MKLPETGMKTGAFTSITSPFIRGKITTTRWKDRSYIHTLLNMQRYTAGRPIGMWTTYSVLNAMKEYPVETLALTRERDESIRLHTPRLIVVLKAVHAGVAKAARLVRSRCPALTRTLMEPADRALQDWLNAGGLE